MVTFRTDAQKRRGLERTEVVEFYAPGRSEWLRSDQNRCDIQIMPFSPPTILEYTPVSFYIPLRALKSTCFLGNQED